MPAPVINTQPVSQWVITGGSLTLTVAATGADSLRWYYDGEAVSDGGVISGAYTGALTWSVVPLSLDEATFFCRATAADGTTQDSATATLRVGATPPGPLAISLQPLPLTITPGSAASFAVAVAGVQSLRWHYNGAEIDSGGVISGADGTALTWSKVTLGLNGAAFFCRCVGYDGTILDSATVILTVTAALPTITQQPANATVAVGASVTLTAAATSPTPQTSQWLKGGRAISGTHATGYTTPILTIATAALADAGSYTFQATNGNGSTVSNPATLTVTGTPAGGTGALSITGQPAALTVAAGSDATLTVVATGSGTLVYQWLKNGQAIPGATAATLTLLAVTTAAAGSYQVLVSNGTNTLYSISVALTVTGGAANPSPVGGVWSLNGTPAATLGVRNLKRSRRSLDIDTCTFDAPGRAIDAAPLFAYGQTVVVSGPAGLFFAGRVTQTPATGTPQGESQSYTLSGPWWYLAHLGARQQWPTPGGGTLTALSGRLILGQAIDGSRQTTGQAITEVLQYGHDSGAPFALGSVLTGYPMPFDEVKDVTVADAVRQIMRWHPDSVSWFDYTTSPPTLHVQPGGTAGTATYTLGAAPLSEVSEITACHDVQVAAVVIHYEVTSVANGQSSFDLVVDAAPAGATGRELNALCVTIPLRGINSTTVEQRIEVLGIRDDLTAYGSDEIRNFLLRFVPELQAAAENEEITSEGITITAASRGLSDRNAQKYDPASDSMVDDDYDDTLNVMLISGSVADWMVAKGIRAQYHRMYFSYTLDRGAGGNQSDTESHDGTLDLTAVSVGPESPETPTSLRYQTLTSYTPGDQPPAGLAAHCYAAFSKLHYSGGVTLVQAEATGGVGIGYALNLAGGAAEWATMAAMIVGEDVDVDSGTTTLTFGPPEHLGPADLIELLRVARPSVGGRASGPASLATAMSGVRVAGN